jgi:uncharacterized protein
LPAYYLDTSALVKLYVTEPGTAQMLRLANPDYGYTLAVASITRVEFRAAVRQRQRGGDLPEGQADSLIARLERHFQDVYLVQPITEALLEEASGLVDRHSLRAYDAIQLAGCVSVQFQMKERPVFVCSDRRLLAAAEREGLIVLDPAADSES